jgi:prepilin signal peptidase PulO-like enzyme (type II secretory pathway)
MTALFVYDLRWKLLPVNLMNAGITLGLAHAIVGAFTYDGSLVRYVLSVCASVLVAAGVFWALHFVSKGKWIGDGDIRLGVIIGLFLADPVLAWAAIFLASLYGIVYALFTVPLKKNSLKLHIPFGPFLILGLVTSYLAGSRIVGWYLDTLLFV